MDSDKDYSIDNIISRLQSCRSNEDEYFHIGECILSLAMQIKLIKQEMERIRHDIPTDNI